MKTLLYTSIALVFFGMASAQNTGDSINETTEKALLVRKQQNLQAAHTEKMINRPSPQTHTGPARYENSPSTTATSTNNGNNKASGNSQPSSTPSSSNTPPPTAGNNGTDVPTRPSTTNTPVIP